MDKINKKVKIPEMSAETKSHLSKWVPLLCAGAAVGIGVIALKEIKTLRTEIVMKQQNNEVLSKKMENLEEQLGLMTNYLKEQKVQPIQKTQPIQKQRVDQKIINNAVEEPEIKIINEKDSYDSDEYEEVEVTDNEEDN